MEGTERLHLRNDITPGLHQRLFRDGHFLSSGQRREGSQKSDCTVIRSCSESSFVTRGRMSPIIPASPEFVRADDQCFRKEETYQCRPATFSTSGEDAGRKQKWWRERSVPPQSEVRGVLAIRHFPNGEALPCLPGLNNHVILCSSESSTSLN